MIVLKIFLFLFQLVFPYPNMTRICCHVFAAFIHLQMTVIYKWLFVFENVDSSQLSFVYPPPVISYFTAGFRKKMNNIQQPYLSDLFSPFKILFILKKGGNFLFRSWQWIEISESFDEWFPLFGEIYVKLLNLSKTFGRANYFFERRWIVCDEGYFRDCIATVLTLLYQF